MTPNLAIVRVYVPGHSFWGFPIVLPLFLLWIPLVILGPLVLLVHGIACLAMGVSFTRSVAAGWQLLCALPGTDVRVTAEGKRILVKIV